MKYIIIPFVLILIIIIIVNPTNGIIGAIFVLSAISLHNIFLINEKLNIILEKNKDQEKNEPTKKEPTKLKYECADCRKNDEKSGDDIQLTSMYFHRDGVLELRNMKWLCEKHRKRRRTQDEILFCIELK